MFKGILFAEGCKRNPSATRGARTRQRHAKAVPTQCQTNAKATPIQCQCYANGGNPLRLMSIRILLKVALGTLLRREVLQLASPIPAQCQNSANAMPAQCQCDPGSDANAVSLGATL
eukprot:1664346-Pyramimonas_sp.AAC.1